jgi:hypothetical protein
MTKTAEREINRKLRQKREELASIRADIEDLMDYLDIVEARARNLGKPRLTHAEVKRRFAVR